MSDGSLRCCANNCIHNEFYECRAGAIVVGGHKATSTKGTFCVLVLHLVNICNLIFTKFI